MSFATLTTITDDLVKEYPENKAWKGSSFEWLRSLPPGSKGKVGRDITSGLMFANNLTAGAIKNSLRVNGMTVTSRLALVWDAGLFKFQNIRDFDFDFIMCIGLQPASAYGWFIPKKEFYKNDGSVRTERSGITKQHKGADAWLSINPAKPGAWLKPYGGTIDEAIKVMCDSL